MPRNRVTRKDIKRRSLTSKALQYILYLYPDDVEDNYLADNPIIDLIEVMKRSLTTEAIDYIKSAVFISTSLPPMADSLSSPIADLTHPPSQPQSPSPEDPENGNEGEEFERTPEFFRYPWMRRPIDDELDR